MRENAAVKQEVKLFGWQLSSPMFEARAEDPSSCEQLSGETVSANCRRNLWKESVCQSFFFLRRGFPRESVLFLLYKKQWMERQKIGDDAGQKQRSKSHNLQGSAHVSLLFPVFPRSCLNYRRTSRMFCVCCCVLDWSHPPPTIALATLGATCGPFGCCCCKDPSYNSRPHTRRIRLILSQYFPPYFLYPIYLDGSLYFDRVDIICGVEQKRRNRSNIRVVARPTIHQSSYLLVYYKRHTHTHVKRLYTAHGLQREKRVGLPVPSSFYYFILYRNGHAGKIESISVCVCM